MSESGFTGFQDLQDKKIVLEMLHHRGEDSIAIRFEKEFKLNSEVKKIPGATFSMTNKCRYVLNDKHVLDSILERLKQKASVDYSALRIADNQAVKKPCPEESVLLNTWSSLTGCDTVKTQKRYTLITSTKTVRFF